WLRSIPYNIGSSGAGSLKADEWCTMIMVYLLLMLVSLWEDGIVHKSSAVLSHLCEALDHTMTFVSTVHITCSRLMTRKHASAYWSYIAMWLSKLKVVHPSTSYHPNGHMTIHIHQFLLSFGPVHSW
ncbi:hypothetical protein HD554DRAFT_2019310, partial [Boletus coccyginus]